jgi:hypothetical protein
VGPRAAGSGVIRKAASFPVLLGFLLVAAGFASRRLSLAEVCSSPPGAGGELFLQGDTWGHIKVGELILATGHWPRSDPYSFTIQGNEWIAYEWLGGVALALANRAGGLRALMAFLVALSGAVLLLIYYYAFLCSGNVKAAFIACTLLMPLTASFFSLRPQLLGYILFLVTLICLEHFRQGRSKVLWVLPVVFLLWVNTHGTFVFGLVVFAIIWTSGLVPFKIGGIEARRWDLKQRLHLAGVFLISLLAVTLTPYGTRVAGYVPQLAFSQPVTMANFPEWLSLDFSHFEGKLLIALILLFVIDLLAFRPSYRLDEMALVLFGFIEACLHARFALLFVPLFAPVLARRLDQWIPEDEGAKDKYLLNAALIVLISVGIVDFFPSREQLEIAVAREFPVKAVEYLRRHSIAGPMWNDPGWGGYLLWALGPDHKVFIDGRLDFYEHGGVLSDFIHIVKLEPDVLFMMRKYGIKSCLTAPWSPLDTFLAAQRDWHLRYADEVSRVYSRPGPDVPAATATRN